MVRYRWHPWFDQPVTIDRAIVRRDRGAVYLCRPTDVTDGKFREVPQWMFDQSACCVMQLRDEPCVSVSALLSLSALLRDATTSDEFLIDVQHFQSSQGDADATTQNETDNTA